MAGILEGKEPALLWKEFQAISNIPRCSKCEDEVLSYIKSRADERGYSTRTDKIGNLVVVVPASAGFEDRDGLVIQGHVDMVCEQNSGTGHDFDTDPIELEIDGEWLHAKGTTLGADNGIAVAIMLSLMTGDYKHPELELLFTIDEETGLTGALELDPDILTHKRLLNIDSEEEGIFYIGCAGGRNTVGYQPLDWEPAADDMESYTLSVTGLHGGHSGADIHKQLGNALVVISRLLFELYEEKNPAIAIADIRGGDKHNAIPREAFVDLCIRPEALEKVKATVLSLGGQIKAEFAGSEDSLVIALEKSKTGEHSRTLRGESATRFVNLINTIPHGVFNMSRTMEGLVSTSSNFAAARIDGDRLRVLTSQRSDIQSQVADIAQRTAAAFRMAGGWVSYESEYPSWEPDPSSELLATAVNAYAKRTGAKPEVTSIHAGLECGVIGGKCGGMDMFSLGPDIRGAHTPEEKVHIDSTNRVFLFILDLLTQL